MNDASHKALLPAGLRDLLPPEAAHEVDAVRRLLESFIAQGYELVKPPLLEFEEALLSGTGAALRSQTFRLMDPVSQRMMGLRADMTPQIVRMASSRLKNAPRPLRLCYAGQVLQIRGSQLRPEREFAQVGLELIAAPRDTGDAEAILLGAGALSAVGVRGLSVDLNLPPLITELAAALGFSDDDRLKLRHALDGKDAAAVQAIAGPKSAPFLALLRAAGPAGEALQALKDLELPPAAAAGLESLRRVVALIGEEMPALTLTVDPVEHRGFEYQTGISFIFFARDVRGELGRGGRYTTTIDSGVDSGAGDPAAGESSTGFSLFMDSVLRALPTPATVRRLFLPPGHEASRAAALRKEGWVTLRGLTASTDPAEEARRLGCSHLLRDGRVEALGDK
jgi:ATP phosphoribosyltransferase regulatory subunit